MTEYQFKHLSCVEQFNIATAIAANIGYKLVEEDNERHLQIRAIIKRIDQNKAVAREDGDKELIKEGLERLLT